MTYTRESSVERYLVKRVKELGGEAYKFVSPGRRGVPDRLVVLPGGRLFFVECKAPGQKVRATQAREIARLIELEQTVYVVDSREEADRLL